MKKNALRRKILALLLLLAMLAGNLLIPAARGVQASDGQSVTAGGDIDGTEEETAPDETEEETEAPKPVDQGDVTIRQQMVYYWHKGLPPADGREYPVLLCWDDKYFMTVDEELLNYMSIRAGKNYYSVNDGFDATGYTNGWRTEANGYPDGQYHVQVGYPTGSNFLRDLDFDYDVLKSTGSAVSFSLPSLPVMKNIGKLDPDPLSGWKKENLADRVMIGIRPTSEMIDAAGTTFFAADETNWLTGFRYIDYEVSTTDYWLFTADTSQKRVFEWYLFPINSVTYNRLTDLMTGSHPDLHSGATSVDDFLNKNVNETVWYVCDQEGKTVFLEKGFRHQHGRISGNFDDAGRLRTLVNSFAGIELGHSGEVFASYGNRTSKSFTEPRAVSKGISAWASVDYPTRAKYGFDVYYAEPNLMYFLKSDITVENGQTQNLDGPLVIEEGMKITVKNGGVLSFTDWIVHQGEIFIEPGGTMILQQNTTANGYTRNCAVVSNNKKATKAGRVACDGNVIVMPNCTLAAGGIYGIQLGEGSQIVNYGQIVAEIWDVYTDYTVEGRADIAAVYLGFSMSDTGFALVPEGYQRVTAVSSLTSYQTALITRPDNWLYGETQQIIRPGTMNNIMPNRRGRVTR